MLTGKSILVTGAESGIGRAIAAACRAAGAQVVYGDVEDRGCWRADLGGAGIFAPLDITDPASIAAALDTAQDRFGRLDGVVANAGRFGMPAPVLEIERGMWEQVVGLNLTGSFLTLQAGARRLVEAGGGALLATGSSLALRPQPATHAYAAAKAGIHSLVRSMALELAPQKVRVNAIAPGVTRTPATEAVPGYLEAAARDTAQGEVAEPDEIGALAAHVMSDHARHMTGAILSLDSGYTI